MATSSGFNLYREGDPRAKGDPDAVELPPSLWNHYVPTYERIAEADGEHVAGAWLHEVIVRGLLYRDGLDPEMAVSTPDELHDYLIEHGDEIRRARLLREADEDPER